MNSKLAWLAGAVVVAAFLSMLLPALALDVGQFKNDDPVRSEWFRNLKNGKGGFCCADADGFDAEWKMVGSKYQVRIAGEWRDVPDDAVISDNKYGVSKVWILPGFNTITCFMPGPLY